MKNLLFALLLFALPLAAQTPTTTTTDIGPQFTVGIGGAFQKYADPRTPQKNVLVEFSARLKGKVSSYNSIDLFPRYALLRTGLDYYAYNENNVTLFLLAQAGLTVSGTSAANNGLTVGNFSGGVGVAYDFGGMFAKLKGKQTGITFITRLNSVTSTMNGAVQTGTTKPTFELMLLKGFGK